MHAHHPVSPSTGARPAGLAGRRGPFLDRLPSTKLEVVPRPKEAV